MYSVYKHTTPSEKVYIGITYQSADQRWRNGNGYHHNDHFKAAIEKYGWQNIKHEILFTGLTKEEAEQKEIELIAEYHSDDRKHGYNIREGGNSHGRHSEETKRKISAAHIGMKYGAEFCQRQSQIKIGNKNRLGQTQSEECKRKISAKNKGRLAGNKNYFHDHKFIGKDHPHAKAVARYDLQGNYIDSKESANLYAVEMGLKNASHITEACRGLRKTAYGYIWKYIGSVVA